MGMVALGVSGIVLGVVGSAISISMSVAQSYQQAKNARAQGKAQQAMANYNARVAENQQIAANQNAEMEMKIADVESRRQHRRNKEIRAKQLALQAKTGGQFTGSALLVDEDQMKEMKLQELDILHQGELKAREHKITGMQAGAQAVGAGFQGQMSRNMSNYRAKSLISGGWMSAAGQAGSSLASLGSMASSYGFGSSGGGGSKSASVSHEMGHAGQY